MEIEMSKVKWDIIRVSEVRRHGENLTTLKSGHIFYSIDSETESIGRVGFFIHNRLADDIVITRSISTGVAYLIVKLNQRYKIKIIQVYAPTTNHPDEEIEDFYDDITAALKKTPTNIHDYKR
ncbi:uncharacterized protein [Diabrotica undecimpunctata]|uniref:uncharacterized protein n=1 Tax=Diabrotica undecimpunctata TaxID=50387 RepID=UPI003B63FE13